MIDIRIWIALFFIFLISITFRYKKIYESWHKPSVQYFMLWLMSIIMIGFLVLRSQGIPLINIKNAEVFINNTINILLGLVAFFAIIFSILSSQLYIPLKDRISDRRVSKRLKEDYHFYQHKLKWQITTMIIFLGLAIISIYDTFIAPCLSYLK